MDVMWQAPGTTLGGALTYFAVMPYLLAVAEDQYKWSSTSFLGRLSTFHSHISYAFSSIQALVFFF